MGEGLLAVERRGAELDPAAAGEEHHDQEGEEGMWPAHNAQAGDLSVSHLPSTMNAARTQNA